MRGSNLRGLFANMPTESLKNYFSQFGEVSECTVMRDSATGRSRGFGFLTFKDTKCVNIVMVKEHYLDGKIIDPKRAIPREEQERTSKIFVGGVSQEATEQDFKNFFKGFGRVVDATLMMDKDTGRPRGFGFVTFDGDTAVDACLAQPLQILGKPIEVKRAQPRGNMREEEDNKKFGRNKFGNRDNSNNNNNGGGYEAGPNNPQQQPGGNPQMTPAMMAQYWQRMQQYFRQMQDNIATGGMGGPMGGMPGGMPGGMNPAMMGMMGGMNPGGPGPMGGQPMNPMMAAQFGNMQAGGPGFGGDPNMMAGGAGAGAGGGGGGGGGGAGNNAGRPNIFNPQDQLAFEQQKYEQQQQRRMQQSAGYQGAGGPTSWEGMYDEIPQPSNAPAGPGMQRMHGGGSNYGGHGKHNRGRQGSSQPPANAPNAPANAPTGPKNAGKPGANYRGGGRSATYRHNPYGGRG
ncbi:RNA-binding domain-containing protein [Massarina eburnea CBS 473.64]|uniref:RNA-binding domain-containing protein n=1 Tax=Massarina eburnea CBS 473.64 TaxID=1395130 RepID=A0A6A6S0C3_9PLEO|nr:RNA-binding domain-containing protein [Massarina eburnea CBS 473.64]